MGSRWNRVSLAVGLMALAPLLSACGSSESEPAARADATPRGTVLFDGDPGWLAAGAGAPVGLGSDAVWNGETLSLAGYGSSQYGGQVSVAQFSPASGDWTVPTPPFPDRSTTGVRLGTDADGRLVAVAGECGPPEYLEENPLPGECPYGLRRMAVLDGERWVSVDPPAQVLERPADYGDSTQFVGTSGASAYFSINHSSYSLSNGDLSPVARAPGAGQQDSCAVPGGLASLRSVSVDGDGLPLILAMRTDGDEAWNQVDVPGAVQALVRSGRVLQAACTGSGIVVVVTATPDGTVAYEWTSTGATDTAGTWTRSELPATLIGPVRAVSGSSGTVLTGGSLDSFGITTIVSLSPIGDPDTESPTVDVDGEDRPTLLFAGDGTLVSVAIDVDQERPTISTVTVPA